MSRWSSEEDQILRTHGPTSTARELAGMLNCSRQRIYQRARRLKITLVKEPPHGDKRQWPPKEDQVLRDLADIAIEELDKYLPTRSQAAIARRAQRLGITLKASKSWTAWTAEKDQILLQRSHAGASVKELAQLLGKSQWAIRARLRRLRSCHD